MDLNQFVSSISPEVYQRLARAVELGKWPDGVPLTAEQKENSLQLVMLWQKHHNTTAEHMTIGADGEIVIKSKQQLKQELTIADDSTMADGIDAINIIDNTQEPATSPIATLKLP